MTLRTRLLAALLVISVVPLGVQTYLSYTSQVRALQEVATQEADALSSEMTARMQLVTTELSARVEQLAEMNQPTVQRVVNRTPSDAGSAESVVTASPATSSTPQTATSEQSEIADALGAAAMLLRSVELQGMRGMRPPPPPDGVQGGGRQGRGGRGGGNQSGVSDPQRGTQGRQGRGQFPGQRQPPPSPPGASGAPSGRSNAAADAAAKPAADVKPTEGASSASPVPQVPPAPAAPASPSAAGAPQEKVVIDMGAIAREMFSKYVPEGGFEKMTPEQRAELAREVNLRMMGVVEGIRISAQQLQKQAEAAKEQATTTASPAAPPASAAPSTPQAPPRPARPVAPTTRQSTLTGDKLAVKLMRDGAVVNEVNATVDLDNLLATVFSPTKREKGEVPFAVGPDGKVYTANAADKKVVDDLGPIARPDGPLGKTYLSDWVVFTTADPSGSGLRFGIARPVRDSLDTLRRTVARNAGLGLLFIAIAIVGVVPLSGRLTRDLTTLTDGVDRIAKGDYRARVPVKARDEIGVLAQAFNRMAEDVERHQHAAVEQERLRKELELGRRIQSDMLPREPMSFGLTEVQGVSIPAREVGGDFFNYFALGNGQVALMVGDVSGKGVGAALLMANIQASLRTRLAMGQTLAAIAEAIDNDMAASSGTRLYVTLFLGIFDPATRMLDYVNAGHNPQFVLRPNKPLERMTATGIPMGLLAGRGYNHRQVQLDRGDLLFFYTDGCVESENDADEMFGADRLESLLVSIAASSSASPAPDQVLRHVETAVNAFRGTRELGDDATMMAVRVG
ncbi:MAG: SpoIIE family protein phosphatase [Acidobacteria bacterium]|nr:SpoIIE family protein phosphatase [Acidobacteriota bacterium]